MSTYTQEWDCCGSTSTTESWEPERCPFCEVDALREEVGRLRGTVREMVALTEETTDRSPADEFERAMRAIADVGYDALKATP